MIITPPTSIKIKKKTTHNNFFFRKLLKRRKEKKNVWMERIFIYLPWKIT